MKFDELKFDNGGIMKTKQAIIFFDNGYGASIIIGPETYGGEKDLYELAVLKGNKDKAELCYDTPITDDVLGHLTPEDVEKLLIEIRELKGEKE